jgi:hypothetical protein
MVRLGDPDPAAVSSQFRRLFGDDLNVSIERASMSGVAAVEIDTPQGVVTIV